MDDPGLRPSGVGQNQGGGDEKDRARQISRDDELARLQFGTRVDADFAFGSFDVRAHFAQGDFGMVAGADRFAQSGDAVGVEAGEQNRGFYLGTGNRRGVIDGFEFRAVNFDGGAVAVFGANVGAHLAQRFGDAAHGAALKRFIASDG